MFTNIYLLGWHDSSSVVYKCKFYIIMKFNSQICTTKEQSERLIALGLKKETADMCLHGAVDFSITQSFSRLVKLQEYERRI